MTEEQRFGFQLDIFTKQLRQEEMLDEFISDRSIYDNIAYNRLLLNKEKSNKIENLLKAIQDKVRYDILFYVPIEFELENDGIRFEDEQFRKLVDEEIKKILEEYKVSYITLRGSIQDRLKIIEDTIREFKKTN